MRTYLVFLLSASLALQGCASTLYLTPVESDTASIRYDQGKPTTSVVLERGAVQVTPLQVDADGRLVFAVAAFNDGDVPANFGIENIELVSPDDKLLHVYSADDLIRDARNKAMAAQFAIALLGAAGAAASQAAAHHTYKSSYHTPHGSYYYKSTYYNAGQAAAGTAVSIGSASAGIYAVQQSLDAAIAGIGQNVLQTTTVDPGYVAAGRVLVKKPRNRDYPQDVRMFVNWNDEHYQFVFRVSKTR